jgi:translation initiation factor 2 beta subunit (eIF-2beta)/eIF-5
MSKMFKEVVVTPLLKKPSLNKEEKGNYHPNSNLFFLSKVIEKVISSQIIEHTKSNNFLDIYQSANREFHSTETLLLHLLNDVYLSIDINSMVIVVLLHMISAFDTVQHDSLIQTLSTLGIVDDALQ